MLERVARSRRVVVLAVCALVLSALFVGPYRSLHPFVRTRQPDSAAPIPKTQNLGAPAHNPLAFYQNGIFADLFGHPLPPPAKQQPAKQKPAPAPPPAEPAPAPNPLDDYVYMGTVTLNGERYALLENRKTKEGHYLKEGDTFLGFTVGGIGGTTLAMRGGAGDQMLAMNDDYDLLPLDKDAPYLGGRSTPHGGRGQGGTMSARIMLARNTMLYKRALAGMGGGEDVEHLRNEVFEGRMTQEEFDRRVSASGQLSATYLLHAEAFDIDADAVTLSGDVKLYTSDSVMRDYTDAVSGYKSDSTEKKERSQPERHMELPQSTQRLLCGGSSAEPSVIAPA